MKPGPVRSVLPAAAVATVVAVVAAAAAVIVAAAAAAVVVAVIGIAANPSGISLLQSTALRGGAFFLVHKLARIKDAPGI